MPSRGELCGQCLIWAFMILCVVNTVRAEFKHVKSVSLKVWLVSIGLWFGAGYESFGFHLLERFDQNWDDKLLSAWPSAGSKPQRESDCIWGKKERYAFELLGLADFDISFISTQYQAQKRSAQCLTCWYFKKAQKW